MHSRQKRWLNCAAREDLTWWSLLCNDWVGSSVHQFIILDQPRCHLYTDASGSWGCGACALPHWFQLPWTPEMQLPSIALKELTKLNLFIVIAAVVWGHLWSGKLVMCHSDNTVAAAQVNRLHSTNPQAGHLLWCLVLLQSMFDFHMRALHIPGSRNTVADELSRNRVPSLHQFTLTSASSPTQIPDGLLQFLGQPSPVWTSMLCRSTLKSFCRRGLAPAGQFNSPSKNLPPHYSPLNEAGQTGPQG